MDLPAFPHETLADEKVHSLQQPESVAKYHQLRWNWAVRRIDL
jgi:hypothetical protein